jgi:hypothetical protein
MISKDVLEEAILKLEEDADKTDEDIMQLLQKTRIISTPDKHSSYISHSWDPNHDKILQRKAIRGYQSWYNAAYQLIKEFLPEKHGEFIKNYDPALEYIQLSPTTAFWSEKDKQTVIDRFNDHFELQRSILLSILPVSEIKELSLRKIIASDFIDSELDKADYLFRSGFARCAGVLAGIALERYLKALCDIKRVEYRYDDTIEPLSQALYMSGKIDPTELKKFQHLGGIRNDCAHAKDVSENDLKGRAKELIENVKKLTL